jgi:rhodanese-related sulfurtransferase
MNIISRWFRRSPPTRFWTEAANLAARLDGDDPPLVLDVRGPDEFAGPLGHIAGSMNVPLTELPARLSDLAREGRPIVVVCKTDRRSSIAAQQVCDAGLPNVSVLRGGMEQWQALGLPVS